MERRYWLLLAFTSQASEVAEELHAIAGDLVVVDTPGQVELFAFREASNHLIEVLGRDQAAIIYLFDPMLSKSPSGFVSQMLLSSIVEFRLGLPTKNVLSKSDLLSDEELEQLLNGLNVLKFLSLLCIMKPEDRELSLRSTNYVCCKISLSSLD